MKTDIDNRYDIELLVNSLYSRLEADPVLKGVIRQFPGGKEQVHLPVMYAFWENMVLQTGSFTGNPMSIQKQLGVVHSLSPDHFNSWNQLFERSVDDLFEGPRANLAKQRTKTISRIISQKILDR